jgi:glycine/D-amino acid oxidase-like deaminating enzyme
MDLHSSYPFWMIKEGILYSFPKLRENHRTSVLIVGGGITGALLAHRLMQEGLQVSVVDKRHIAHGSTSASTALLQYEIDVHLFELIEIIGEKQAVRALELCSAAIDRLEALCNRFSDRADFMRCPSLLYASYQKHLKEIIQPELAARKKHGFKVTAQSRAAIAKKFGFMSPGGILSEQAAHVNPYKLCLYLLKEVSAAGGHVFDSTEIMEWETDRDGVWLRTYEGFEIDAEHVVIACGYESENYLPETVTKLNSTYAVVSTPLEKQPAWYRNSLIWETKSPYLYLRTTADGRVIVGGRDEAFYHPEKRDALLPMKRMALASDFRALFPDIPFEVDFAWAGTFAETEDGLPFIGSYDDTRVHFAMGYGGNGITFSVIAADLICDEIMQRNNRDRRIFGFEQRQRPQRAVASPIESWTRDY